MSEVETAIRRIIVKSIMGENDESLLGFDVPLFDEGILDSVGLMHLVLLLDEEYNVSIPLEDLVPEHFESIRTISEYLETRLASPTMN